MQQTEQVDLEAAAARRSDTLLALALTLAGLAAAIVLSALSDGFYHDDDITHFQIARNAWTDRTAMWYWWARPGYNFPTMLPARFFGVLGCRIFSALQTAAVAYLAYLIARRLGRSIGLPPRAAALAPALVWLQPMVMTLSCTTLTETPAALYVTLAVWLYLRGNRVWGCAALSPAFITRYEVMALAPVVAGAVLYDAAREANWKVGRMLGTPWAWASAAALLWAPAAYVFGAHLAGLPREESILCIFSRAYSQEYGRGQWSHFAVRWLLGAGAGTLALAAAGALGLGRRGWLVTALAAGLVIVHTLVYRFGSFASGGYERFLVPVGGLVGALAAAGVGTAWQKGKRLGAEAVFFVLAAALFTVPKYAQYLPAGLTMDRVMPLAAALLLTGCLLSVAIPIRWRWVLGRAGAAAAVIAVAVQAAFMIRPLTIASSNLNTAVDRCAREVAKGPYARSPALTTHVLVPLLHENTDVVNGPEDGAGRWRRAGPGTLFFWDSKYGGHPTTGQPWGRLFAALEGRGRLLTIQWVGWQGAAVFLRLPDELPTSRADASTQTAPGAAR